MPSRIAILAAALAATVTAASVASAATTDPKISRALSAGPPSITANATVVERGPDGKMTVLRKGTNGWTCVAGDDPVCGDAAASQWARDLAAHKPKPTNMKPGIAYMLAGGTVWSATDPYAPKGTAMKHGPHTLILWPFDKSSGLPTTPRSTGPWIMFAGTPYAHLMIPGKP